jgi:hypothetical protein
MILVMFSNWSRFNRIDSTVLPENVSTLDGTKTSYFYFGCSFSFSILLYLTAIPADLHPILKNALKSIFVHLPVMLCFSSRNSTNIEF